MFLRIHYPVSRYPGRHVRQAGTIRIRGTMANIAIVKHDSPWGSSVPARGFVSQPGLCQLSLNSALHPHEVILRSAPIPDAGEAEGFFFSSAARLRRAMEMALSMFMFCCSSEFVVSHRILLAFP